MIEAPHTETPPTETPAPGAPYTPATWPSPPPMVWDYRKLVPLGIVCLVSVVAISYWLTPAIEEVDVSPPSQPVMQRSGIVATVPPGQPSPIVERLSNELPNVTGIDPAASTPITADKDAKITLLERKVNAMAREVQALKQRRASNQEEATPRRKKRVRDAPPKRRYARPARPSMNGGWFF